MNGNDRLLLEALTEIARLAGAAAKGGRRAPHAQNDDQVASDEASPIAVGCVPRSLPKRLVAKAAAHAGSVNPVNRPFLAAMAGLNGLTPLEPMRIAVITTRYWGPTPRSLTVSFTESTPTDLQDRIIAHLNAWSATGCISFVATQGAGQVRISRGPGGYWSYLGTDINLIPTNRPTMNLEAFTMSTPESEYRRVVRHEAGHTLGFPHEHMRQALVDRIDPGKAYEYFWRTQGWDQATVDQQVLRSLDEASLISTPPDQTSIMCYQLPGSITVDGEPILGGDDVNPTDLAFVGKIYPKQAQAPNAAADDGWPEEDDVSIAA